jgi:hypothetical protein
MIILMFFGLKFIKFMIIMKKPKLISQKKLFLKALKELDTEILNYILSDDISYFGANKEIFIDKMGYIFRQIRLGGWNENLHVIVSRKYPNTYYLNIKDHDHKLKFIITENNGTITSVTNDLEIKSKEDVESLSTIELFFGLDERANFFPSTEYVMTKYKCDVAYKEIIECAEPLTFNTIENWLDIHKELYQNCTNQYLYFQFQKFTNSYNTFEYLFGMLQYHKLAELALSEYQSADFNINVWKEKYYELAYIKIVHFRLDFSEYNKETKIVKSAFQPYRYYQGIEFISLLEFSEIYFGIAV